MGLGCYKWFDIGRCRAIHWMWAWAVTNNRARQWTWAWAVTNDLTLDDVEVDTKCGFGLLQIV